MWLLFVFSFFSLYKLQKVPTIPNTQLNKEKLEKYLKQFIYHLASANSDKVIQYFVNIFFIFKFSL
jgi:hypothetical protein